MSDAQRKSYRVESDKTMDAAVQLVRQTYQLNTNADAWRRAMRDELLLLKAAEHPEIVSAMKAMRIVDRTQVTALERWLFHDVSNASDVLEDTREMYQNATNQLQSLLLGLTKMGSNLNQIAKQINSKHAVIDEELLLQALSAIETLRGEFVQPVKDDLIALKEVLQRGSTGKSSD